MQSQDRSKEEDGPSMIIIHTGMCVWISSYLKNLDRRRFANNSFKKRAVVQFKLIELPIKDRFSLSPFLYVVDLHDSIALIQLYCWWIMGMDYFF